MARLRGSGGSDHAYTHPFYWAAFEAIGLPWRPSAHAAAPTAPTAATGRGCRAEPTQSDGPKRRTGTGSARSGSIARRGGGVQRRKPAQLHARSAKDSRARLIAPAGPPFTAAAGAIAERGNGPDPGRSALRDAAQRRSQSITRGAVRCLWRSALGYVRDGDVLIVWKLDRLGRSLPHLIETVMSLEKRGVGFRSLTETIDTTTPGGRLVFHLFGALGQFECEFARNTDPLRADFAFKSDPSDGCVSILPHGPEWPGRILGDGIGGPDRQGSARIF